MNYDFLIVGAGIAGASVAAELAAHGSVAILEAEDTPGYHATGRSAAFWSETYGGPCVQPLTTASYPILSKPPDGFSDHGFLQTCGALHIADAAGLPKLEDFRADFIDSAVKLETRDRVQLERHIPGLKGDWRHGLYEPSCASIDVAALHQAYLATAKRAGAELHCANAVTGLTRVGKSWRISSRERTFSAEIVVNAAGAWVDQIAAMAGLTPLGITACRRTMLQLAIDPPPPEDLPLVIDARGRFYFKAEPGGRLWLSPHDEIPVEPGDAVPEELDIAVAIDRLENVTDWKILRLERKWAGLRSFSPDRLPVYGFDPKAPGFFWCAGQGGVGIQTAPAAAMLCRSIILGRALDDGLTGIDPKIYDVCRFDR